MAGRGSIEPVNVVYQGLVIEPARDEHGGKSTDDPIDLFDMSARKFCVQGCAIDLHDTNGADEHHKKQKRPIEVAEGDVAPHQLSPGAVVTRFLGRPGCRVNLPPARRSPLAESSSGAFHRAETSTAGAGVCA